MPQIKFKKSILFLILNISISQVCYGQSRSSLNPIPDTETIKYLFEKAVRLSGIAPYPFNEIPPIYYISKKDLNKEVCPEDPDNCRNLAAVFDDIGYRILVLEDLKISSNFNPFNYSFVIHELIHSLQYRSRGAEIFNGCDAVYKTEFEAYTAQDLYLKEEGDFFRAAISLKYFYCDEDAAKIDYSKSKAVWDARHTSGSWHL